MWLVVNAGSSSLKLAVFDADLAPVARSRLERIGLDGAPDHAAALAAGLAEMGLSPQTLKGAAHRVVHGGPRQVAPARVTPAVLRDIGDAAALAPLHNPANLMGIGAVGALSADLPQFASFDTAFHATIPEVARSFALPQAERVRGLRRYGFHGLSYAALVRTLACEVPDALPPRLLALHLGNGASLCAIRDGESVATTMGYSPLDGLTMGTRAGSLDPAVVVDLCRRHGPDRTLEILNRECGLLALGGASDLRALHAADTAEAAFAIEHFCYWVVRHAGSLVAALGGLDAIAFTGGIGENDAQVRARVLTGLAWAGATFDAAANRAGEAQLQTPGSPVAIFVIPADEERQIALEAQALHRAG